MKRPDILVLLYPFGIVWVVGLFFVPFMVLFSLFDYLGEGFKLALKPILSAFFALYFFSVLMGYHNSLKEPEVKPNCPNCEPKQIFKPNKEKQ